MAKPLAGRKAFEAMGRRAYSLGLSINHQRAQKIFWPTWARSAWARGWIQQAPLSRSIALMKDVREARNGD